MTRIHKTHFTVPEMPWKKECKHTNLEFTEDNKLLCLICKKIMSIEEAFPELNDKFSKPQNIRR